MERVAGGYIVLNGVKLREQLTREQTPKQDAENDEDREGFPLA